MNFNGDLLALASFFAGISLLAVGGGDAALPAIQQKAVHSDWVTPTQFLHLYALGQLAPGPGTMYVAGIGYVVAGVPGALVAGLSFVLPSSIMVIVVSRFWNSWSDERRKTVLRTGLAPVTVALLGAGAFHLITDMGGLVDTVQAGPLLAWAVVIALTAAVTWFAIRGRMNPAVMVISSGVIGLVVLR